MEKNAASYISFKRTLGSLLFYAHKLPDPLDRKEYRYKYDTLKQREGDFKVDELSPQEKIEILNLDRLIRLYDNYNSEISDMRRSEIYCEIMKLSDELGVKRETPEH